jgi:Cu-processing system ATP-binding protein
MSQAVHVDRLTHRYGERIALHELSFFVDAGEIVALLGPNGSGKTTTIKAAAGLIRPTSGEVLLGEPALSATDPVARLRCSFLPQRVAFPEALTGREVIDFYRRLRHVADDATTRVLRFAALNGSSTRAVGTYSGGMLQRLGLAVAMLPESDVLLLDEPSAALDPEGLQALYALIEERRRAGGTVLFSSHQLGDAERMADWIAVMVQGRLVAWMNARELADRLADRGVMRVRVNRLDDRTLQQLRLLDPTATVAAGELQICGRAALRPQVIAVLRDAGSEVVDFTTQEGRLDDLYRTLMEEHA